MRPAALLDALVGAPRQLERDVDSLPRVGHAPVRLCEGWGGQILYFIILTIQYFTIEWSSIVYY